METLQRLHNRGSISTGYEIDNSVKLEADNSEYLSRTIGSTSNRKTFTVSCWFKRTELKAGAADANGHNLFMAGGDSTSMVSLQFHTWQDTYADTLEFRVVGSSNNNTTRRFRDTSAWYHVVLAVDTTQATEANRWKLYVNGVQETSFSQTSYPSQNADTVNNVANNVVRIGTKPYGGNEFGYFAGYIADYYHIDGQALAPTDFGEFDDDSGIWKPKAYTGSFGTNGWYLDFVDGADLGDDESGNGNDFTENNITAADQATDTPTNNFTTINTLQSNNSKLIISNGATSLIKSGNHGWQTTSANMAVRKGKWYAEFKLDTNASLIMLGVNQIEDEVAWNGSHIGAYSNSTARGMAYYSQTGYFYRNGGSGAIGSTYAAGDIIGIALLINDNLTGFMGMHKNGTWQNSQDPSSGTTGMLGLEYGNPITDGISYTFAISNHEGTGKVLANFGGFDGFTVSSGNADANGYGNFEYAPPTGYYALCTKNLEEFG